MKINPVLLVLLLILTLSGGFYLGKGVFSPINPKQADFNKMLNYAQASIHEQKQLEVYQKELTQDQEDFTVIVGGKKYKYLLGLLEERLGLGKTMDLITCAYKKQKCPKGETQKDLVQAGLKLESYLRSTLLTIEQKEELGSWWEELQKHQAPIHVKKKLNLPDGTEESSNHQEQEKQKRKNKIRAEFNRCKRYIYGPLASTKNNKSYYKRLYEGEKKFISAGISRREFENTLALAKRRIEFGECRFMILCITSKINCSNKYTSHDFTQVKLKLFSWRDDHNAFTTQQRTELNDFLNDRGIHK